MRSLLMLAIRKQPAAAPPRPPSVMARSLPSMLTYSFSLSSNRMNGNLRPFFWSINANHFVRSTGPLHSVMILFRRICEMRYISGSGRPSSRACCRINWSNSRVSQA